MARINAGLVSIVIPVYNEQENLPVLYSRLKDVFNKSSYVYEMIFVDDGSRDDSWASIESLCAKDSAVKGLKFSRNFGHQCALTAGMDYASGDAVITMDADLQHPPDMLPQLIQKWEEGYDIVYTIRKKNKDSGLLKNIFSNYFYTVINKLACINIPAGTADFRLLGRNVVNSFKDIHERTRFLRGLVSWVGYKSISLPYIANERYLGKSKYSFRKMAAFAIAAITSFSSFPLYVSSFLGLAIASISFCYGIYAIYGKLFTDRVIPGWTSVFVSILFLGGIQLIAIGVLGEYLARVYEEVKQRPLYLIMQKKGF
ncbi:MAG: glycosyltransferase family 2 protein [Candidatus Omnitrophota bacterium]|jgi:dolichol-phosphate mannosyltransferase